MKTFNDPNGVEQTLNIELEDPTSPSLPKREGPGGES